MKKNLKPVVNFLFELGMMKKLSHAGLKFAGVKHPDTLAEHTCRAAQIAYILAIKEKQNPLKAACLCLMHDLAEIRTGDAHRIAQRYLNIPQAEKKAFGEQVSRLPDDIKNPLSELWNEFSAQKTELSKIARDADHLETILQAKEYLDLGHKTAQRWIVNGGKYLRTKSAKRFFKEIKRTDFANWWDHLNKA